MVNVGSSLIFGRCQQMSAFQHSSGLLLDFGGAGNRTITTLSNCGVSVSTSTVYNQRKAIEKYHDAGITKKISKQKEGIVLAAVTAVPCLELPVYCRNSSTVNIIRHMLTMGLFSQNPYKSPPFVSWDIYGDNLDYSIKPFRQTMTKRTQDIHWFLLVGAPLRVIPPETLDHTRPRKDIADVPNAEFMPGPNDHDEQHNNFVFHVLEILTQYIPFLKKLKHIIPKYIDHIHVKEMSKKSDYVILDVLDKSENKNDDMIDILNYVHQQYVPFVPEALGENTLERMVFGGDQLTNERAYSAQLNMANGTNSSSSLKGIIHRTEGLHLCMNTCLYIMQTFYSATSVRDFGTLYQLKTLVDRRNVTLEMTTGYNQAKNLIDDTLDSHIIACALDYFGMDSIDGTPTKNVTDLTDDPANAEASLTYLTAIAVHILDKYVLGESHSFSDQVRQLDADRAASVSKLSGKYQCPVTNCGKCYSSEGWLKKHLKNKHGIVVESVTMAKRTEPDSSYDGVNNYARAFMKISFLFRDIRDAYKMGDGDRLFRDLKFLMLFLDQSTHIKYRLWVWRMLAYDSALLSEYERYAYRWNLSMNVSGGVRHCIPNDNLVEIHVHKVKVLMRAMGANVSYEAVRRASKCLGTVECLIDKMGSYVSGRHADSTAHKLADIREMFKTLVNNGNLLHTPGREHTTYPNFPHDLLNSVDLLKLNNWMHDQKNRAS